MADSLLGRRDLLKARDVAIKVIDADAVDYNAPHEAKDESIGNIHQEAKILSQLKGHRVQNVNYMYDVFVVHSQLWIVNEYCTGGSVRTLVRNIDPLLCIFTVLSMISVLSFCYKVAPAAKVTCIEFF